MFICVSINVANVALLTAHSKRKQFFLEYDYTISQFKHALSSVLWVVYAVLT